MKPFISDHKLNYIDKNIISWISGQPFSVLLNFISGQSIKYLRSEQQTLIFSVPDDYFDKYQDFFIKLSKKKIIRYINYKNSFRVIYYNLLNQFKEYHFVIQRTFVYPHVLISIDRLKYDYKKEQWVSKNEDDVKDYYKGFIRLIKPKEIDIKQIFYLIVYTSMLDFTIEDKTMQLLQTRISKEEFDNLDIQFIRSQFTKILLCPKPSIAFFHMDQLNLLEWILPELTQTKGFKQSINYKHDLFHHCLYTCDSIQERELHFRLTGLLSNIGKIHKTKTKQNGKTIYLNHDIISAKIAYKILKRLEFHQNIINKVYFLIRHHMFYNDNNFSDKALIKFINKISESDLKDLIDYNLSERKTNFKNLPYPPHIRKLLLIQEKEQQKKQELKIKDLTINGEDLKKLGIQEGPIYGKTLRYLLEKVKNNEISNEYEILLENAIKFINENQQA